MTNKVINEAAKAHSRNQLGEEQFKANKDAVKAISEDFKAGVKWANEQKQPLEDDFLRTVRVETPLGTLTISHEEIDREGGFAAWLKENSLIAEDETEDNITYWAGPNMTREEYNNLPELS